ncbi:hypothetical protein V7659_30705, partial [Neobacillus drentensis]|uniref:hypothetical protein n=1 Tax=Neobacillus drentensis TaxID=220684 RepID=UPI002FFE3C3B
MKNRINTISKTRKRIVNVNVRISTINVIVRKMKTTVSPTFGGVMRKSTRIISITNGGIRKKMIILNPTFGGALTKKTNLISTTSKLMIIKNKNDAEILVACLN